MFLIFRSLGAKLHVLWAFALLSYARDIFYCLTTFKCRAWFNQPTRWACSPWAELCKFNENQPAFFQWEYVELNHWQPCEVSPLQHQLKQIMKNVSNILKLRIKECLKNIIIFLALIPSICKLAHFLPSRGYRHLDVSVLLQYNQSSDQGGRHLYFLQQALFKNFEIIIRLN